MTTKELTCVLEEIAGDAGARVDFYHRRTFGIYAARLQVEVDRLNHAIAEAQKADQDDPVAFARLRGRAENVACMLGAQARMLRDEST